MPEVYNPKINRGLKVEYANKIYDKIMYLSISNNISCKLSEIKITIE